MMSRGEWVIFGHYGLSGEDARKITEKLKKYNTTWNTDVSISKTIIRKNLRTEEIVDVLEVINVYTRISYITYNIKFKKDRVGKANLEGELRFGDIVKKEIHYINKYMIEGEVVCFETKLRYISESLTGSTDIFIDNQGSMSRRPMDTEKLLSVLKNSIELTEHMIGQ